MFRHIHFLQPTMGILCIFRTFRVQKRIAVGATPFPHGKGWDKAGNTPKGRVFPHKPSSWVSEESLSSVGMSSLSLKSSEGEFTGPMMSIFSPMMLAMPRSFSTGLSATASSSSGSTPSNCSKHRAQQGQDQHLGMGFISKNLTFVSQFLNIWP